MHVVAMIRNMRNALAHGDGPLWPNVSHEFQAGADFINQLFPPLLPAAKP